MTLLDKYEYFEYNGDMYRKLKIIPTDRLIKGIEQRDLITKGAILNFIMKCEENYKEELK